MIGTLTGPDLGIEKSDNYLLFEWSGHNRIVFSIVEKGDAILCHFAAEKGAIRYIKPAFNEMCDFIFDRFKWCTMVLATVIKEKPSIMRVLIKCEFKYVAATSKYKIYARLK